MSDGTVEVTPSVDATLKKVDNEFLNVGGQNVYRQRVAIPDGADVTNGATADAAVVTDVAGSASGKLRGLVKWAFERMPTSLGQKTSAASLPVVLPSDQTVAITAVSLPLADGAAADATLQKMRMSLNDIAFASILDAERNLFT